MLYMASFQTFLIKAVSLAGIEETQWAVVSITGVIFIMTFEQWIDAFDCTPLLLEITRLTEQVQIGGALRSNQLSDRNKALEDEYYVKNGMGPNNMFDAIDKKYKHHQM